MRHFRTKYLPALHFTQLFVVVVVIERVDEATVRFLWCQLGIVLSMKLIY